MISRRSLLLSAATVATAATVGLAGCSPGSTPGSSGTPGAGQTPTSGSLRVMYFANDARAKSIQAGIDVFTAAHPEITVQPEHTPFASYFDKVATQFAANDAADVVMLSEQYLADYVKRRAVQEFVVDTSGFDPAAVGAGVIDGRRYGIAGGVNTMTLVVNPKAITDLGLALPDDSTWTWDDYATLAAAITEKSGGKVVGSSLPNPAAAIEMWLRQSGAALFTADGKVGFEPAALAPFLELMRSMGERKALPAASVVVEQSKSQELSGIATNATAMGWFYSGGQQALEQVSGATLTMVRPPSQAGSSSKSFAFLKSDSLWSINTRTEVGDLAALFISQLSNNPQVLSAIGTKMGVPANLACRTAAEAKANATEKQTFAYVDAAKADFDTDRAARPAGASQVDDLSNGVLVDVLFGRVTPEAGAQRYHDDLASGLS